MNIFLRRNNNNQSKIPSSKKLTLVSMMISLMLVSISVSTISVQSSNAQNSTSTFGEVTSVFVNGNYNR